MTHISQFTIDLGVYDIVILSPINDMSKATMSSSMKRPNESSTSEFNAAVQGIESMILSAYQSGYAVEHSSFITTIKAAYTSLQSKYAYKPTASELATILAALRYLQANRDDVKDLELSHFDRFDMLNDAQIDELCEKINFN